MHSILIREYPALGAMSISTVTIAWIWLGWESKRTRYCALIGQRNVEKGSSFAKTWSKGMIGVRWRHLDGWIFNWRATGKWSTIERVNQPGCALEPSTLLRCMCGVEYRNVLVQRWWSSLALWYTDILVAALVLFIESRYPAGHRFHQDNDPKHTSRWTQDYFIRKGISLWKTPPSSTDLSPIENIWGSMREYLRIIYMLR